MRDRGRSAQPADPTASVKCSWRARSCIAKESQNPETLDTLRPRHAGRLDRAQPLYALHGARRVAHAASSTSCCSASSASRSGPCRWSGSRSAAAGVINGIGHFWGYRNFQPADASTQHRAVGHPDRRRRTAQQPPRLRHLGASFRTTGTSSTSAGSTSGCCEMLGLAEVKKVAPRLKLEAGKTALRPRYAAGRHHPSLRRAREVCEVSAYDCADEISRCGRARSPSTCRALKRWLHIDTSSLPRAEREQRRAGTRRAKAPATVYTMRDELAALWERSTASKEQLVHQLEDWCRRAEASGIEALQTFSRQAALLRVSESPAT